LTFDERLQRKTFTQTVQEARRTLFDVSRTAQPPASLPTGRRSIYDALVKARQEVNAKTRRGVIVPSGAGAAGVDPSAASLPVAPDPVESPAPAPASIPVSSTVAPSDASCAEPESRARSGLIGLLIKPRNRPPGE
jgi:hypothetical protein